MKILNVFSVEPRRATSLLAAIIFAAFSLNAQVTIGSGDMPQATLDVVTSSLDAKTPEGVIAPRMTGDQIKAKDDAYTDKQNAALVYATTASSDMNKPGMKTRNIISKGYYYYDAPGKVWVGLSSAPLIIIQPRSFNWKETVGAGALTGVGGEATTISVEAVGADLTYQWYEVARNPAAAPIALEGAIAMTYTPTLTELGMKQYYCEVTNESGTVRSDIAKVAVGCGAMTADGNWRSFMCYNLGATVKSINEQMTAGGNIYYNGAIPYTTGYTGDAANAAVFGGLFQWGRYADGHQGRGSRNSLKAGPAPAGSYSAIDTPWDNGGSEQILSTATDYYGRFITNGSSSTFFDWSIRPTNRNELLWRNYRYIQNDPCANLSSNPDAATAKWRLPNASEWGSIFRGDDGAGSNSIGHSNTWVWKAPGTTTNSSTSTAGGYEIRPDGITTTLFLPAAGHRVNSTGTLAYIGVTGYYWSTTTYGNFSESLRFDSGNVFPAYYNGRGYGFSVRCIAEN
jgi:hypothetical protein